MTTFDIDRFIDEATQEEMHRLALEVRKAAIELRPLAIRAWRALHAHELASLKHGALREANSIPFEEGEGQYEALWVESGAKALSDVLLEIETDVHIAQGEQAPYSDPDWIVEERSKAGFVDPWDIRGYEEWQALKATMVGEEAQAFLAEQESP